MKVLGKGNAISFRLSERSGFRGFELSGVPVVCLVSTIILLGEQFKQLNS